MKSRVLALSILFVMAGSACSRQPCPNSSEDGPNVKLDVALGACNHVPEAVISGRRKVGKGQDILLDGRSSSDLDGEALAFQWALVEQPAGSAVTLLASTAPQVRLQPDMQGQYVFELVVSDGELSSHPGEIVVLVVNRPPVADAGQDASGPLDLTITLDGSASADPDGDPLSYRWTIVERPSGSSMQLSLGQTVRPTLTPDTAGLYRVQLVVNDGEQSSPPDEVQIAGGFVGGSPPIANAGPDAMANIQEAIVLDGVGSSDPDGDVLTYVWRIASSPPGSQATLRNSNRVQATLTPDLHGMFTVELMVSDGVFVATDTVVIDATSTPPPPPPPPQGVFHFDPAEVYFTGQLAPGIGHGSVAHWSTPNQYVFGAGVAVFGRILSDGRYAYVGRDGRVHTFMPDTLTRDPEGGWLYPSASAQAANDPDISGTIPCMDPLYHELYAGRTGFWVRCGSTWHHEDGRTFSQRSVPATRVSGLAMHRDTLLVEETRGLVIASSTGAPDINVTGLPANYRPLRTSRVVGDDYWVVFFTFDQINGAGVDPVLYRVTQDGRATHVGDFPPTPPNTLPDPVGGRLDRAGNLFQFNRGTSANSPDLIIRRNVNGTSEVVYSEADNPAVKVHVSVLATGP